MVGGDTFAGGSGGGKGGGDGEQQERGGIWQVCMCMYMHVYVHACVCTCMCMYMHVYVRANRHANVYDLHSQSLKKKLERSQQVSEALWQNMVSLIYHWWEMRMSTY